MDKDEKKRQIILKQVPFLEQIPARDQISVFNKAARSPIVLGVAFLLIFLLLYVQFDLIMSWSENPIEASSYKKRFILEFNRIFVPILLPAMGIFFITILLRNALLKREIKKYLNANN